MRRLAITGFCAIALLAACAQQGVPVGAGPPIMLPCPGKNQGIGVIHIPIGTGPTIVQWVANGTCKVTKFIFIGNGHDPPPGFTQQTYPPSATILYDYNGQAGIPTTGYYYYYVNDDPKDGNGSGIIKN